MVSVKDLNHRSREILKGIVEAYLDTGEPVGSRFLSRNVPVNLSPATIRNVMADLEDFGLLCSPHTSAGRIPTDAGLRMFVDGLLQVGVLSDEEQRQIETQLGQEQRLERFDDALHEASHMLSGLSRCAGLVLAPKGETIVKHIEFVRLEANTALVVLVTKEGGIENRIIDIPAGLPGSALTEAGNFLNARLKGLTFSAMRAQLEQEIDEMRQTLSDLTRHIVEAGLATWSGDGIPTSEDTLSRSLIISGQSRLLDDVRAMEDLERIRLLFEEFENKGDIVNLLGAAEEAEGVRLFIGAENQLFALSGSSVIVSPFRDQNRQIVGVLGVIGPTRLNYGRVIPVVDYTATVMSRMLGRKNL